MPARRRSSPVLRLALIALAAIATAPPAAAQSLLVNGSFDRDLRGWSWAATDVGARLVADRHSGRPSHAVSIGSYGTYGHIDQRIAGIVPGRRYRLGACARVMPESASGWPMMALAWEDAAGDQMPGGDWVTIHTRTDWSTMSAVVTAPDGAASVTVRLWMMATGSGAVIAEFDEAWFAEDDARLEGPPLLDGEAAPDGIVGAAYAATLAAWGEPFVRCDVIDGSLPEGVTLASDGTVAGTPTRAGTAVATIRATNALGSTERELVIAIRDAVPPSGEEPTPGGDGSPPAPADATTAPVAAAGDDRACGLGGAMATLGLLACLRHRGRRRG